MLKRISFKTFLVIFKVLELFSNIFNKYRNNSPESHLHIRAPLAACTARRYTIDCHYSHSCCRRNVAVAWDNGHYHCHTIDCTNGLVGHRHCGAYRPTIVAANDGNAIGSTDNRSHLGNVVMWVPAMISNIKNQEIELAIPLEDFLFQISKFEY